MLKNLLIGGLVMMGLTGISGPGAVADELPPGTSVKQEATYYTPQRIEAGKRNVAQYDWGKAQLNYIMVGRDIRGYINQGYLSAREYSAQTDDFMWALQPSSRIPRIYPEKAKINCPQHGREISKVDAHNPWKIDPINHPYKIQCPIGKEWYPSNDYANGDMTTGPYADDGNGFEHNGERFYPIREYAFFVYNAVTIPVLRSLSQAYVLTGDKQYARKGAILLAKLASEYPNFDERKDRLFYATTNGRDEHYTWKTGGMMTDLIWETFCLEATAYAYDAFFPYLDQDPELIRYLGAKGMPVKSGADLRRYIEEKILRVGMQALLSGDIRGNEGHHQAAAMACALVMNDFSDKHPNSQDMVDFVYYGAGHSAFMFDNGLTRDGGGHESPGYNKIKLDFIRTNRLMEELRRRHPAALPAAKYPDLFASPKARGLFDSFIDITSLGYFMPSIGDSGGIQPVRRVAPHQYSYLTTENLFAFERYGDPRYARALTNSKGELQAGELFEPYPEAALKAALQKPESKIEPRARLLDGYGIGILEAGEGLDGRAAVLNYTSLIGHRQFDNLSLEFYARGVDQLPDLGYPYGWRSRWQYDSNSMAHNTVTVDETQPVRDIGGAARLFGSADGVQVVTAQHDPYPAGYPREGNAAQNVDLYERTVLMVNIDPQRFYLVDLFAVRGGTQHDQSWHGPLRPMQLPDLKWQAQQGGTLAGKDIEKFAKFKDKWGRERDDFPSYLFNIKRAPLAQPATFAWDMGLPEGDALRLHVVPVDGELEAIAGNSTTPDHGPDWNLDYLLARRTVQPGQASRFLTVIDSYQKTPTIEQVRLVSAQPLVLEVKRSGGIDEIHLNIPTAPGRGTAPRPLGVRVVSREGNRVTRDVQIGQQTDNKEPGYATGSIIAVDYAANRITLDTPAYQDALYAAGHPLRIYNADRTALFRITASRRTPAGLELTLDQTALLGRGPISAIKDGLLTMDSYLLFGRSALEKQDDPVAGLNFYRGSYLGEGPNRLQLRGALGDEKSTLYPIAATPDAKLQSWKNQTVSLWQYAPGDKAETPVIETKGG